MKQAGEGTQTPGTGPLQHGHDDVQSLQHTSAKPFKAIVLTLKTSVLAGTSTTGTLGGS